MSIQNCGGKDRAGDAGSLSRPSEGRGCTREDSWAIDAVLFRDRALVDGAGAEGGACGKGGWWERDEEEVRMEGRSPPASRPSAEDEKP